MNQIELLNELKTNLTLQNNYIKTIPVDLRDFVCDNVYSSLEANSITKLIEFTFNKNVDLVFEWLYDDYSDISKLSAEELVQKFA